MLARLPVALGTAVVALASAACVRGMPPPPGPGPGGPGGTLDAGWEEEGVASWYGTTYHGRPTASGEIYDMDEMTAAHRTLPFGTVVNVRNLDNGLTTTVRINDRGPFLQGRNLDLSRRAAQGIDMLGPGTARVRLTLAGNPRPPAARSTCWMVQAGQYPDVEDAGLVRRSLERDGHGPVGVTTGIRGLHRVRVGPLDSRAEAEELSRQVNGMLLNCEGSSL